MNSTIIDEYRGTDVADSIVAHSPRGTVHALRPAGPEYLISVDDRILIVPAVTLARHLIGHTDDRGRWAVPAALAPTLVEALQSASDGDTDPLIRLCVQHGNRPRNTEKKEQNS